MALGVSPDPNYRLRTRRSFAFAPFIAAAAALACQRAAPPAPSLEARDAQALGLIRAEFRRRAEAAPPRVLRAFRPAAIDFRTEQSTTVAGLTYWWGYYTYDYGVVPNVGTAIPAARSLADVRLLRTSSDWFSAAAAGGWRPQTPASALTGCVEAAITTSPRSVGPELSFAYRDSFQLRSAGGHLGMIAEPLIKSRRLTDSRSSGDAAHGFVADFWMFERGQASRYRCRVEANHFTLVVIDSIADGGFPLPL